MTQSFGADIEMAGLTDVAGALQLAVAFGDPEWLSIVREVANVRAAVAPETHPFAPSPVELPGGDVLLGRALFAEGTQGPVVGLTKRDLSEHLLVTGTSGAGKSVFLTYVAAQIIRQRVPVWIIDTEGLASQDDYFGRLAPVVGQDELLWFDLKTFKRNPFEPLASESVPEMIQRCRDVFSESFWFGETTKNLLGEALGLVISERGVRHGSDNYPTLADLVRKVETMRPRWTPRLADARSSLLNRLVSAVELMPCYDVVRAGDFAIDRLIDSRKSVVFQLRGGADFLNLFVKDLLKATSSVLEQRPSRGLQLVVLIDEAHRFVNTGAQSSYEPILLDLAATLRKRGCGLLFATQSPSELPVQIAAVCNTRVSLRLVDGRSARYVADSMALGAEQRDYLLGMPDLRAVVHYRGWPRPFVMELPEVVLPTGAPSPAAWMATALERMNATVSAPSVAPSGERSLDRAGAAQPVEQPAGHSLSKEQLDYLEWVAAQPLIGAVERDRAHGLSAYKGNSIRNALADGGYLEVARVTTGRRGGTLALLELTAKAHELLRTLNIRPAHVRGRGSLSHKYYQWRVWGWAQENGWNAEIEAGEARADVALERDGRKVAVEIELREKHAEVNVAVDLQQYDEVWVVAVEDGVLERAERKVREQLDGQANGRVQFIAFSDLTSSIDKRKGEAPEGSRSKDGTEAVVGHGKRPPLGDAVNVGTASRGGATTRRREVKQDSDRKGERKNQRPNRNEAALEAQVGAALRRITDASFLDELPLAHLAAVETYARQRFTNRATWRGLGLQDLLLRATALVADELGGAEGDRIAQFVLLYREGHSVSEIARRLGVTREHATRDYRPEAIQRTARQLSALLR